FSNNGCDSHAGVFTGCLDMTLQFAMNRSHSQRALHRRGVAAVEGAIVLGTMLLLLFGILDLGLATCRYNTLSAAARGLARVAITRGVKAPPEWTAWGPNSYSGNCGDSSEMAATVTPLLCTMRPGDVALQIAWPDGAIQPGDRVSVQLTYTYR